MIEVPAKMWRPKVVSKYTPPNLDNTDIDNILDYSQYGKCVYKPNLDWSNDSSRMDIITYDKVIYATELTKDLQFDDSIDTITCTAITDIIAEYWDCFIKEGAIRTILGHEFGIDTGGSTPVCCHKPSYDLYEPKVIMEQITQLLGNTWINRCEGSWGSIIVFAQKSHQANIINVADFIWSMCVSYRRLNTITKPFQFPIPRCDDAIIILGNGVGSIWIISLDARQGYHHILVRQDDREKIVFLHQMIENIHLM